MTDISIERHDVYRATRRPWLWGPHGTEPGTCPSIPLDFQNGGLSAIAVDGYVPNGTVLGKITATGKYGAYDPAATDGRNKAAGLLFLDVKVPASPTTVVGGAIYVHGMVDPNRLPIKSGPGFADDAAKTALSLIYWA